MQIARLTKRADFLKVSKNGRRWVTPAFVVQIRPTDSVQETPNIQDLPCRVGFTATKRLDKRAVVRNRAKRRLREMSQSVLQNYDLYGKDVVFIARDGALNDDFADLLKNCRWALKRLEIKKHGEVKESK